MTGRRSQALTPQGADTPSSAETRDDLSPADLHFAALGLSAAGVVLGLQLAAATLVYASIVLFVGMQLLSIPIWVARHRLLTVERAFKDAFYS